MPRPAVATSEFEVLLLRQEKRLKQHIDHALQKLLPQLAVRSNSAAEKLKGVSALDGFELAESVAVTVQQASEKSMIPDGTVAGPVSPGDIQSAEDLAVTVAPAARSSEEDTQKQTRSRSQ